MRREDREQVRTDIDSIVEQDIVLVYPGDLVLAIVHSDGNIGTGRDHGGVG